MISFISLIYILIGIFFLTTKKPISVSNSRELRGKRLKLFGLSSILGGVLNTATILYVSTDIKFVLLGSLPVMIVLSAVFLSKSKISSADLVTDGAGNKGQDIVNTIAWFIMIALLAFGLSALYLM